MTMPTAEQPGLENALIVAPADSAESTEDVEPAPKHSSNGNTSLNSSNLAALTPQRQQQQSGPYSADLNKTPIASAKRPAGLARAGSRRGGTTMNNNSSDNTNTMLAAANTNDSTIQEDEPLSPMHGVKTVENVVEQGDCARGLVLHHTHHAAAAADGKAPPPSLVSTCSSPASKAAADEQLFSPVATALQPHGVEAASDDESMASPEQPDSNSDEFNPWQFIQSLPPYAAVERDRPAVTLPALPSETTKTLVLDLDETLVHCSIEEPVPVAADGTRPRPPDLAFPVQFHGAEYTVYVRLRPHLQRFLETVAGQFEVVCFTASQKVYADALLDRIDPEKKLIHHRLFRDACLCVEGNFLKDLNVLGRDLRRTVLVDNSPHAFGYQVDNGIPIESWFDCPDDTELLKLARFLQRQVLPAADVRDVVRRKFESQRLVDTAPPLPHY